MSFSVSFARLVRWIQVGIKIAVTIVTLLFVEIFLHYLWIS